MSKKRKTELEIPAEYLNIPEDPFVEEAPEFESVAEAQKEIRKVKEPVVEPPVVKNIPTEGFVLCKADVSAPYSFMRGDKLYSFTAPDFTCLLPVELAKTLDASKGSVVRIV